MVIFLLNSINKSIFMRQLFLLEFLSETEAAIGSPYYVLSASNVKANATNSIRLLVFRIISVGFSESIGLWFDFCKEKATFPLFSPFDSVNTKIHNQ